jgi:hypothetical protein
MDGDVRMPSLARTDSNFSGLHSLPLHLLLSLPSYCFARFFAIYAISSPSPSSFWSRLSRSLACLPFAWIDSSPLRVVVFFHPLTPSRPFPGAWPPSDTRERDGCVLTRCCLLQFTCMPPSLFLRHLVLSSVDDGEFVTWHGNHPITTTS